MIKKIAWNTFKNTGDINTFLELKKIENIEGTIDNQKNIQETEIENKININNTNSENKEDTNIL